MTAIFCYETIVKRVFSSGVLYLCFVSVPTPQIHTKLAQQYYDNHPESMDMVGMHNVTIIAYTLAGHCNYERSKPTITTFVYSFSAP